MPGALAELVPAALDLRAVLEPFADVLSVPHAKFAGAGGEVAPPRERRRRAVHLLGRARAQRSGVQRSCMGMEERG